jgi:DNA repair protein RecO (recombination protein O)
MMIKTEGIVLGEMKFKDSSKIITLYTKKLGKIPVLAQGVYRPKSQLLAATQSFSLSEFCLKKGKNFYYIIQADLIDSFYSIRENIERLAYGFYLLELVEKATPDEEENQKLFLLLEKGLLSLANMDKDFVRFIAAYELKFISFIGYRPYLDNCVVCNSDIGNDNIKFSIVLGGVLCSNCLSSDFSSKPINHEIIDCLNILMYTALDELYKVNILKEVLNRLHKLLVEYILFNIEVQEFKSLNLIKDL